MSEGTKNNRFDNKPVYNDGEIADYRQRFLKHLSQTVPGEKEMIVVEAKGCAIKTAEGLPCLDMISGIAVANVGHSHPEVVDAVQKKALIDERAAFKKGVILTPGISTGY